MKNHNFSAVISFAIFKSQTEEDQRLNSDLNYGSLINRFYPQFFWISAIRNFQKTSAIHQLGERIKSTESNSDILFVDWINRTCIHFLQTNSKFLLVLDACLAIPDDFEEMLSATIPLLEIETEALAVWPVPPIESLQNLEGANSLKFSETISELAFILTRAGAKKLVSSFDQNPKGTFSELISILQLKCQTISQDSLGRPFAFTDLELSQRKYASTLSSLNHESKGATVTPLSTAHFGKPKIQAFISHWFSTWESVKEVEAACQSYGYSTSVLNTTLVEKDSWVNKIPISFFRQIEYACSTFDQDNDFLLFITADVRSNDWFTFFSEADKILSIRGVGTLSPTLSNEWYHLGRGNNYFYEEGVGLAIVPVNDIIVIYVNKSVVIQMKSFFQYFSSHKDRFSPTVGPGLELLMKDLVENLGLFSLRSRKHTLMHPYSKSYSGSHANNEYETIRLIQKDFIEEYFHLHNLERGEGNIHLRLEDIIKKIQHF